MKIRAMQPNDWVKVSEIYKQGIDTNLATFQTNVPPYEEWDQSHLPCCRIIAEENGIILGWAALSPVSSRPVYAGLVSYGKALKESAKRC